MRAAAAVRVAGVLGFLCLSNSIISASANLRRDASNYEEPSEIHASGNFFTGLLWHDMCQKVSENVYETDRRVFVLVRLLRLLFRGKSYMDGECNAVCSELCKGPCFGFTVSSDKSTCHCLGNTCSENGLCIDEKYCKCSEGFDGDGLICCDSQRQVFSDGLCVETSQFIKETFVAAGIKAKLSPTILSDEGDIEDVFRYGTGGGGAYEAAADLELTKNGVVSLAADPSMIESVTCYTDGTINVRMNDETAEAFGPCELFPNANGNETETQNPFHSPDKDGYLRIQSHEGSVKDAKISGAVVSFMSLFDEATISIRRLAVDESNRALVSVAPNNLKTAAQRSQKIGWNLDKEGKLLFEAELKTTNRCYITDFLFEKGAIGWQYDVTMALDLDIAFEASLTFGIGLDYKYPDKGRNQPPAEKTLANIPIYGISLKFVKKLAKLARLELPSVEAGVFLETIVGYEVDVTAEKKLGPKFTATASSGRKEVRAWVYGSVDFGPYYIPDPSFGSGHKILDSTSPSLTSSLSFAESLLTPPEVKASIFIYFKEQLKLAFSPVFSLTAPLQIGFELGANVAFPHSPLEPLKSQFGYCHLCHFLQFYLAGKVKADEAKIIFMDGIPLLNSQVVIPTFKYEFTKDLATLCLLPQHGTTGTIACGNVCCDGMYQACQNGRCVNLLEPTVNKCNPNPCFRGECIEITDGIRCKCDYGWKGSQCDVCDSIIDPCCGSSDPLCGGTLCSSNGLSGHCLEATKICPLPLTSPDCSGTSVCCIDDNVSCATGGYHGFCKLNDLCLHGSSVGTTIGGLCPGPSNIRCCLEPNPPECTAYDKFPGNCTTTQSCNENKLIRTPLSGSCSGGQSCCVQPPTCNSGNVEGRCMHTSVCGFESIATEGVALCPGDTSIQCCIDLPKCNIDNVEGQCMDKDKCTGERSLIPGQCPGNAEIQCCIVLPTCKVASVDGKCLPATECSGLPALSWHNCPGRTSLDVACCIPNLSCEGFSGDNLWVEGECQTVCRSSEFSVIPPMNSDLTYCPKGLVCCIEGGSPKQIVRIDDYTITYYTSASSEPTAEDYDEILRLTTMWLEAYFKKYHENKADVSFVGIESAIGSTSYTNRGEIVVNYEFADVAYTLDSIVPSAEEVYQVIVQAMNFDYLLMIRKSFDGGAAFASTTGLLLTWNR